MAARAVLVMLVVAGCAAPVEQTPELPLAPIEMERVDVVDPGCEVARDYRSWASESVVAVVPPGCGLTFPDVALPVSRPAVLVVGRVDEAISVRVLVGGEVAAAAVLEAAPGPRDVALEGGWIEAGVHEVRVEHTGSLPFEIDVLLFERQVGADTAATAATGDGGTRQPIDAALPIPFESEDFTRADGSCSPAPSGPTEVVQRQWARGGFVVRLPQSGCGFAFEDASLPAPGRFTAFSAHLLGNNSTAVLRVSVEGQLVAAATFAAGSPVQGLLEADDVAKGTHDVRIEVRVVAGNATVAEVDYIDFQTG